MPETDRPGDGAGLTETEIEQLRIDHLPDTWHDDGTCRAGCDLPCPVVRALDALAAVTAERDDLLAEHDALAFWRNNAEQFRTERDAARERLTEATKAGTPYWHERDAQNALILENQRLTVERDAAREHERDLAAALRLMTGSTLYLRQGDRYVCAHCGRERDHIEDCHWWQAARVLGAWDKARRADAAGRKDG